MEKREKYMSKELHTYEIGWSFEDYGYKVTIYDGQNPLRTYTVAYSVNHAHQRPHGITGVEGLKDLAKHDIEKGWVKK